MKKIDRKMMENQTDYEGIIVDGVQILDYAGSDRGRFYNAICSCGKPFLVRVQRISRALNYNTKLACGCKEHPMLSAKVGQIFRNNRRELAEVLEIESAVKVKVKFLKTGWETVFTGNSLKKGSFVDRFSPFLFGVGYLGNEGYEKDSYSRWAGILERCLVSDENFCPAYQESELDEIWYNYSEFKLWFFSQPILSKLKVADLHVDKDLLVQGNKNYSPELCCLIPKQLNSAIVIRNTSNTGLPGVSHRNDYPGTYRASSSAIVDGRRRTKYLLSSKDPLECFYAYKEFKEAYFKDLAEKWKEILDNNQYEALYNRKILLPEGFNHE